MIGLLRDCATATLAYDLIRKVKKISKDPDVHQVVEFLKNRFYFVTFKSGRTKFNTPEFHYFCIDDKLKYKGYYSDFGPLHLGMVYKYATLLDNKLRSECLKQKAIVHYTTTDYRKHANSAFLAGAFAVMVLNLPAENVWRLLTAGQIRYTPFRDASYAYGLGFPMATITILDCLCAIEKALKFKFFNFRDFDEHHFNLFEVEEYSELNWIVPEKLVAMCNPGDDHGSPVNLRRVIKYFIFNKVYTVIRLNSPDYNPKRFTENGIHHLDFYFDDGTPPPLKILLEFLRLVESCTSAVAVHCKAGLGRTGCLIGAYIVKHYKFSSLEAIAWMRICRPGMVVGVQNQWLCNMQESLWRAGDFWRLRVHKSMKTFPMHERGIYSMQSSFRTPFIDHWLQDIERSKNEKLKKKMQRWRDMLDRSRPLSQGDYLLALKKLRQGAARSYTR